MQDRELPFDSSAADLILRSGRNWTAVGFFGALSLLHLTIAIPSFLRGHWEGYLSMGFGVVFAIVAGICWLAHYELAILGSRRMVRVRSGYRRLCAQREIPFKNIHAVRLTVMSSRDPLNSRIELLCANEDIECPPSPVPSQEALCLALMIGVRLIKVLPADEPLNEPRA